MTIYMQATITTLAENQPATQGSVRNRINGMSQCEVACVNVCFEMFAKFSAPKMYLFHHVVYSCAHADAVYERM